MTTAPQPAQARPRLALAGRSVRGLAEAAWRDGFQPLALDLFGDADTLRVSPDWQGIGDADTLRLDPDALCSGLRTAAAQGAIGWLAGSGFDGDADLLAAGASCLPLWGVPADRQRALRDPAILFGLLDRHGLPHPPVVLKAADVPGDGAGTWLLKRCGACGGEGVRRWSPGTGELPAGHCLQRWWPGVPMSATFVADGRSARVLGHNRQAVHTSGHHDWLFAGAVGPVALPPAAAATVRRALAVLVPAFGLVGLGSLDFLLDGDAVALLELNARPPATLALYPDQSPVAAHLWACGYAGPRPATPPPLGGVRGFRHVFSPCAAEVTSALAAALAASASVHDLPHPGVRLSKGAPVCTVSATADTEAATLALLASRSRSVHHLLESLAP